MQNKLQNMRIFVCVANANSFTAAARLLNTTIPQVSRAIAALEAHLHTRLLNRTTRRLALTEAGERYLHRCRSILGYLDEAEAEARDANVNPSGCLRVHCAVSLGQHYLVPAFAKYRQRYPDVLLDMTLSQRAPALVDEGFDVSVVVGDDELPSSGLIGVRLGETFGVLCASRDYLDRHGSPRRIADMATRNEMNSEWGYLLEFTDRDGILKRWAVPAGLFAGDGTELRRMLLDMGVKLGVTQIARTQIANYVQMAQPDERVRCVPRVGWHHGAFVLPDRVIGTGKEALIYQADTPIQSQFKERGTLEDWQREVAAYCVGNSRLLFCVATAFAGPLLHFSGLQSGGFHLLGTTSKGKSTGGVIAASVFGSPDYVRSWKATDNALEAVATQHSDALLILDEIGQVEPRLVGDVIYMLANESGKARASRSGSAKPVLTWRLLFLSNGEKSVSALMAEGNKPMKGGIEVRLPAIPAEVGEMGVVEKLHGFPTPAALIEHLERHAGMHYGTAGPAFIEWASSQAGELAEHLRVRVDELVGQWVPDGSHSQVARVAKRFCLVAVAGELATAHGLTGWPEGEAVEAARRCFEGWLELRGGTGNSDEAEAVRQVQHFLAAHGDNRFVWMNRAQDDHRPNVPHRAGFKQHVKRDERRTPIVSDREYYAEFGGKMSADDAESVETEYLIEAAVFRKDVCAGFDHKIVAKALMKRGVLMPRSDGYPYRQEYIPGHGKFMVYRVLPSIFTLEL